MKAAIIGAGVSGLTMGALLARKGAQVTVFEQNSFVGGVTSLYRKDGYAFEQGPLMLSGMLPGERSFEILQELGITLETVRAQRSIAMPDFTLTAPEQYAGEYWRRERLKQLFPEETDGINRYYRFYDSVMQASRVSKQSNNMGAGIGTKLKTVTSYLRIKKYIKMNADELMAHFFKSEQLKALFTGFLADVCVAPSEFYALGIPFFNCETAFDKRIPLNDKNGLPLQGGFCCLRGGVEKLPLALAETIRQNGGEILTSTSVEHIKIEDDRVCGVQTADGEFDADVVVGSGGGRELFLKLVGRQYLDPAYARIIDTYRPMEAVFMLHLAVDFDPLQYQKDPLCYYYRTCDVAGAINRLRSGIFHEGEDGFLIYVPSAHSPELAQPGGHCVTIYTVCPDTLAEGSWEQKQEFYADRLLTLAEQYLPDLRAHITQMSIITPPYYRRIMHTDRCAFGGVVPISGLRNPPHKTPVEGLYFVGQQSSNMGGVSAVLEGSYDTFIKYLEPICEQYGL